MLPALHNLPTGFRAQAPQLVVEPPPEPEIVAAARIGDVAQVRALIAAGVDIDEPYEFSDTHLAYSQGVPGRVALGVAAFAGRLQIVKLLIVL